MNRVVDKEPLTNVADMWREERAANELMILTLYEKPLDFPNHYVVRPMFLGAGQRRSSRGCMLFAKKENAALWVCTHFPDLTPVPRSYQDEPQVVGSWI